MALYKVIAEQKITKKVLVVVEANTEEEAMNNVCKNNIISIESTLDTKIDQYIALEADKY